MLANETNKHWNVGYVSGAFDMFHIGHLNLIRRSKERCERLIVGVLPDEVIGAIKGRWPVVPLAQRMDIIAALKYVDEVDVTIRPLLNKTAAWEKYRFDAMFSGDDHKNDGWVAEEEDLQKLGADIVFFPYTKEVSTAALQDATLPPRAENAYKPEFVRFTRLFPFDKVDKGERVVIYGAGRVGEQYFRQLAALDYCEIVFFADSAAKSGDTFYGKPCLTPRELGDRMRDFDRIVVASTVYHSEILGRLRSMGVAPERIV